MTDSVPWKKKLIEVAIPLDAINAASARENFIYKGNPSSLHKWWAQRPLAACRAVLFAQLVDDPSARPEQFPTEEAQNAERERLFRIIEDLVVWENSTNERVLDAARAEILKTYGGHPPKVMDPFAGGGTIPLEAQRLGLEAQASDLNPVAVLITKALIEMPVRWTGERPVHQGADNRTRWDGAEGIAEDVRRYGMWVCDEAEKRIGHLYPQVDMLDGSRSDVIAWIWARTIACPNPACGAQLPLVRSFWLSKRKGNLEWIKPVPEGRRIRYEIARGSAGPNPSGTVGERHAVCLSCNTAVPLDHVRAEGVAGRLGTQLMAIAAEGHRARVFFAPSSEHIAAAQMPEPSGVPDAALPAQALGFRVQAYGMTRHSDLFTHRQLTALMALSDLVREASGEWPGGIAPPGSRRTRREGLPSPGSHRPT